MKRKPPEVKKGAPEYMNTYGDMVTLLLCFFVLLFAMSTTDAKKFESMVAAFKGSLGVLKGGKTVSPEKKITDSRINSKGVELKYKKIAENISKDIEKIEKQLNKNVSENMKKNIEIRVTQRGIEINFGSEILFDSGKAALKSDAKKIILVLAKELSLMENKIVIEGHTDNVPIKSFLFPSNWELSTSRSVNVLRYIIEKEPSIIGRISAAGYADTIPKADNRNDEGKRLNRRVQIVILKNDEERTKNTVEGGN